MFSIIIPVYNGAKHIDGAIESVLSQTVSDWELLIVDDGSTDDTASVLEKYAGDSRITVISQPNSGVSAARNTGIAHAKGSHLAFLDADDVWHPDHLEVMRELIAKYPDAGLYGTFTKTKLVNGSEITSCDFFKDREETVYLEDFFEAYRKDKSAKMFTVITTCTTAEAMKKAGGFPLHTPIGEDLEMSLRVAAYYPVVLSSRATATYVKENSTATKDNSFDPDWGFFDTVEELYADPAIPESKKENLKKVMQWFTMRRARHYLIAGERKKAWEQYHKIGSDPSLRKDKLMTLVLLFLPTALVKKLFAVRWRGKA